ncbi:MAG: hypothetical protein QXY76_03365 [Nitrososphaeria archaeon]
MGRRSQDSNFFVFSGASFMADVQEIKEKVAKLEATVDTLNSRMFSFERELEKISDAIGEFVTKPELKDAISNKVTVNGFHDLESDVQEIKEILKNNDVKHLSVIVAELREEWRAFSPRVLCNKIDSFKSVLNTVSWVLGVYGTLLVLILGVLIRGVVK